MNKIEKWLMRRLIKKMVKQGGEVKRITTHFNMIHEELVLEYSENSPESLYQVLNECMGFSKREYRIDQNWKKLLYEQD